MTTETFPVATSAASSSTAFSAVQNNSMYRSKYGEFPKLNHINYSQWRKHIEVALRAEDAFELTQGDEIPPPDHQRIQLADFRRRKGKAIALIFESCTTTAQQYLEGFTNPREMWNLLSEKLNTAASRAGRMATLRQFSRARPVEGKPIVDYISTLLYFRDQLSGTEEPITDSTFISHLLMTLPAVFDTFSDILLGQRTVDELIAKIRETEDTLRTRQADYRSTNTSSTLVNANALAAKVPRRTGYFRGKGGRRPTTSSRRDDNLACWYCNKRGHRQDSCRTKKKAEEARTERLGKRRRTVDVREIEPAGAAAYATVQALVAQINRTSTSDNWVIDSGASHHLCRNRLSFSNLKPLRQPVMVRLGDSSTIPATAAGTICLSLPSRTVSIEALFVPRLQTSLLSVSQLSTKHQIAFRNSACFLDDTVLGLLHEGIYRLTTRTHRSAKATSNHSTASSLKPASANSAVLPSIELWHQRLGHLSHQGLGNLLPDTAYTGGPISTLPTCEICVKSKHQRKITREAAPRTTEPFQLIHSDLCGPISPESASGLRYFILYIDDFSRMTWVYFLRSKASVEVVSVFQEFQARIGKRFPNFPITRFRCDHGKGEYDNSLFRGILRVSGISFEPSPPYTQHKNGVSERMIRTIVTKARAMILDSRLSDEFWAEAVNTAVYLHARSPSRSVDGLTPYEMLFGHKPELGYLRRFGCVAYKLIPEVQRKGKFAERAKRCGFLGYVHETTKIWRLWDPQSKRVVQASDIRFVETEIIGTQTIDNEELNLLKSCIPDNMPLEEDDPIPAIPIIPAVRATTADDQAANDSGQISPVDLINPSENQDIAFSLSPTEQSQRPENPPGPVLRRSTRLGDFTQANQAMLQVGIGEEVEMDPLSYSEALAQYRAVNWKEAMTAEFRSLNENETWTYCSKAPDGIRPIGCKWVYLLKTNPDGSHRFKARLVIKGYEQTEIGETFAPVAKLVTLRMVLALSTIHGWEIDHMDVVTAFLNPPVNNDIYMFLPEGIDWLDPTKPANTTICKLNKALYGLKEAPRLWYHHIDKFLQSINFQKSTNDPNLYQSTDGELLLILYVDDLLLASKSRSHIDQAKQHLHKRYRMNDLGPARRFLGLEIESLPNGHLRLHQRQFIAKVLHRFNMKQCNGTQTPMETNQKLLPAQPSERLVEPREYQSLVGSLMYLAVGTRPDIAYTVAVLSKFNAKPTDNHFLAAKRLLRYLKQTASLALVYSPANSLFGYTDSDFAGDIGDRKSTSGYVFILANAAISWRSKKQTLVSLSSTEAEYVGCSEAAREAIWLRRLYNEITTKNAKVNKPAIQLLLSDSQGAISLAETPRFHNRTKHIAVKYHFVRDSCATGSIHLEYIPTTQMTADIMTKALPRDTHQRHVLNMGLQGIS